MDQDGEGRTDDGLEGSDDGWYFDLPNGAWERQEQKNRELRESVRHNIDEVPEPVLPPDPFRARQRGFFGRRREDEPTAREFAGGKWTLSPNAGEPAPVGLAPEAGDDGRGWQDAFPVSAGSQAQWSTEIGPAPDVEYGAGETVSRPDPAAEPESPIIAMRSWLDRNAARNEDRPQPVAEAPASPPPLTLRRSPGEDATSPAPSNGGEPGATSRWDAIFGGEPEAGTIEGMRAWALARPIPEDPGQPAPPAEDLFQPFEWEQEASVAEDQVPAEPPLGGVAAFDGDGEPADERGDTGGAGEPARAEAAALLPAPAAEAAEAADDEREDERYAPGREWEPATAEVRLSNSWATAEEAAGVDLPRGGYETDRKPGLLGRLFGRKKREEPAFADSAANLGASWTLAEEDASSREAMSAWVRDGTAGSQRQPSEPPPAAFAGMAAPVSVSPHPWGEPELVLDTDGQEREPLPVLDIRGDSDARGEWSPEPFDAADQLPGAPFPVAAAAAGGPVGDVAPQPEWQPADEDAAERAPAVAPMASEPPGPEDDSAAWAQSTPASAHEAASAVASAPPGPASGDLQRTFDAPSAEEPNIAGPLEPAPDQPLDEDPMEPASLAAYREGPVPGDEAQDDPWAAFISARRASGEPFPKVEVSADNAPAGRDFATSGNIRQPIAASWLPRQSSEETSPWSAESDEYDGGAAPVDDPWAAVAAASGYGGEPNDIAVYRGHEDRHHHAAEAEAEEVGGGNWGDELGAPEAPEWAGPQGEDDVVLRAFYAHANSEVDDGRAVEIPWGREETQEALGPLLGREAADLVEEVSGAIDASSPYPERSTAWPMAQVFRQQQPENAGWRESEREDDPWGTESSPPNEPQWGPPPDNGDGDTLPIAAANGKGRSRTIVREVVETVLLAVLVFLAVRASFQNFKVDGQSMDPTLADGQFLIVNKLVYAEVDTQKLSNFLPFIDPGTDPKKYIFNGPERGDIIVLIDPRLPSQDLIKRVIGLPGDTIEILDGRVYINDFLLEEPYIKQRWNGNMAKLRIPENEFFVMGDNRSNSLDSRSSQVGLIREELIIGKAMFSYWPTSHFGLAPNGSPTLGEAKPKLTTERIQPAP